MTTAIMSDHSIALGNEEQHLRVPVVGTERPAVVENDGLTGTPVFVEDFGAVAGGETGHFALSFFSRGRSCCLGNVATHHHSRNRTGSQRSGADFEYLP